MQNMKANEHHVALRLAVIDAMRPFQDTVSETEKLAILAYLVGQMVACQDPKKYTPEQLVELVATNMEKGNMDAVNQLKGAIQ